MIQNTDKLPTTGKNAKERIEHFNNDANRLFVGEGVEYDRTLHGTVIHSKRNKKKRGSSDPVWLS